MAPDTPELEVTVVTWFRVDDSFYDHPKAEELSDAAIALWTRAGSWCSKHLTDGRIPYRKARKLCDSPDTAIAELIKVGLWEDIPAEESAQFHDWTDWNPSRAEVMAERDKNAARQKAWRDRKAAERLAAEQTAARNGDRNAVTNGAPSLPVPSQPDLPTGVEETLFPPPPAEGGEGGSIKPARARKLPDTHRFDEFWNAYPHKRDKDQAKKTWVKILRASERPDTDVLLDEVIAGAGYYHLSKEFQGGTPKYPSTFLNAGSWRDYCNGPPQPGTALVALDGGLSPKRPVGGFDAKVDEFASMRNEMRNRAAGGQ